MSLSYDEFIIEGTKLVDTSQQNTSCSCTSFNTTGRNILSTDCNRQESAVWNWCKGKREHVCGNSYLVTRGHERRYREDSTDTRDSLMFTGLEDSTMEVDHDTISMVSYEDKYVLFDFHIVYHVVYQTPVLFFQAYHYDATPLTPNAMTNFLQTLHFPSLPSTHGCHTMVSMDEHPVLGTPFWFLHPCETATAMTLLLDKHQTSINIHTQSSIQPRYLSAWLSLVQPLTRFPSCFHHISN